MHPHLISLSGKGRSQIDRIHSTLNLEGIKYLLKTDSCLMYVFYCLWHTCGCLLFTRTFLFLELDGTFFQIQETQWQSPNYFQVNGVKAV